MKKFLQHALSLAVAGTLLAGSNTNPTPSCDISATGPDKVTLTSQAGITVTHTVSGSTGDFDADMSAKMETAKSGKTASDSKTILKNKSGSFDLNLTITRPDTVTTSGTISSTGGNPAKTDKHETKPPAVTQVVCPDIASVSGGLVEFLFDNSQHPSGDTEKTCHYEGGGTLMVTPPGIPGCPASLLKPYMLMDAYLEAEVYHGTSTPQSLHATWDNTLGGPTVELFGGLVTAHVDSAELTYTDSEGITSGNITISFDTQEDIALGFDFSLLKHATGTVTLNFGAENTATLDASGKCHFEKKKDENNKVEADADLTTDGWNLKGNFKGSGALDLGGAKVNVSSFTGKGTLSADTGKLDTENLAVVGTVDFIKAANNKYLTGTVNYEGAYDKTKGVEATVDIKNLTLASSTFTGNLKLLLDADFNLISVAGDSLTYGNEGWLDIRVNASSFFATKEGLVSLHLLDSHVIVGEKFKCHLASGDWSKASGLLQITGDSEIGRIKLACENFRWDANDNNVYIQRIHGTSDYDLVRGELEAVYEPNKFEGTVDATFAKYAAVTGTFGMGIAGEGSSAYNWGKLGLGLKVSGGVPLGSTGFKLTQLGGLAGYNEYLVDIQTSNVMAPMSGSYVIGADAGVSDMPGLIEIHGAVRANLGPVPAVHMEGDLNVPAGVGNDKYVSGGVKLDYAVGDASVSGKVNSTVNFPANGFIVSLSSGEVAFNCDATKVGINAPAISGQLLRMYAVNGNANVNYNKAAGTASGSASLTLGYHNSVGVRWPDTFDPSTETLAQQTSSTLGYGVKADAKIDFTTTLSLALLESGDATGSASVHLTGTAYGAYRTPKLIFGDDTRVSWFNASVVGDGSVEKKAGASNLHLKADFTFTWNEDSVSEDLEFDLPGAA